MQAYKLKVKIDESGHLIIDEPLNIVPGKVEVIILRSEPSVETSMTTETQLQSAKSKRVVGCPIPILKEWLESTEPTP